MKVGKSLRLLRKQQAKGELIAAWAMPRFPNPRWRRVALAGFVMLGAFNVVLLASLAYGYYTIDWLDHERAVAGAIEMQRLSVIGEGSLAVMILCWLLAIDPWSRRIALLRHDGFRIGSGLIPGEDKLGDQARVWITERFALFVSPKSMRGQNVLPLTTSPRRRRRTVEAIRQAFDVQTDAPPKVIEQAPRGVRDPLLVGLFMASVVVAAGLTLLLYDGSYIFGGPKENVSILVFLSVLLAGPGWIWGWIRTRDRRLPWQAWVTRSVFANIVIAWACRYAVLAAAGYLQWRESVAYFGI